MKKYLLPETGEFYKANLHCHTSISDGGLTPEEVKRQYMAQGYSIVAYTDHDVLLDHSDLAETGFLPLNGFEAEINEKGRPLGRPHKTCHICFVAKEPGNVTMPFYHRSKYMIGHGDAYRSQIRFDESQPDFEREYTGECINEMIRLAKEAGFFVTYNHPCWSLESYPDYMRYDGMDAMEIINFGSWNAGWPEYNPRVYDDMLRGGKRVYAIGGDDNHGTKDACGAWIRVKAEKLEYKTVMDAIAGGKFYASMGPEIRALWYEDGFVHVQTSEAKRILCNYGLRRVGCVSDPEGKPVTQACFPVDAGDGYFRITVVDEQGYCADTNAYFVDTLL